MRRLVLQAPLSLLTLALVGLAHIYQYTLSPVIGLLFGPVCRFYPTCSQYFILSVQKYGPVRGTVKGIWRVCRCNPWSTGGFDPP